jgi:hypothetical protein
MPQNKNKKGRFSVFGYGVIALYVALMVVVAGGVYGINLTRLVLSQSSSEQARAQRRIGRMVITGADRAQCRTLHFNNETAEVSTETQLDCDDVITDDRPGGSYGMFRDGFTGR